MDVSQMRNIITQELLLIAIEPKVEKGCSYLDAILDYAEKNGIELESIGEVVKRSQILKEKIKSEAILLAMVKSDNER